jgi:hypothetical protein
MTATPATGTKTRTIMPPLLTSAGTATARAHPETQANLRPDRIQRRRLPRGSVARSAAAASIRHVLPFDGGSVATRETAVTYGRTQCLAAPARRHRQGRPPPPPACPQNLRHRTATLLGHNQPRRHSAQCHALIDVAHTAVTARNCWPQTPCLSCAFLETQTAGSLPGGPLRTAGRYSSSCSLPSNVRPAIISRLTSGYPS